MTTKPHEAPGAGTDPRRTDTLASRAFWATIVLFALATIGLSVFGSLQTKQPDSHTPTEIPRTTLERILSTTATAAKDAVVPDVETLLDTVYAPAYAAIPEYADFHYSVLGEYVELTQAVQGKMSESLHERLFDGFSERFETAAAILDQRLLDTYRSILDERVAAELSSEGITQLSGGATEVVLDDARARARVTLPIATVAAGIAGSGSLKVISASIAKKLAAKIATKASGKVVAKGGGILTGAGGGALLCSWSGPGAVVCGVVGGTAAWLLTDAVVLNIDEYFNREDFEADLRGILDEDRAEKHAMLIAAMEKNAAAMDASVDEIFTLRDLPFSE